MFQTFNYVFVPTFCDFVDYLWLLLENSVSKNMRRLNYLGRIFVYCSRIHFTITKTINKLISTITRFFISLVGSSETVNTQLVYNWLKIETFQQKFDKNYFFINTPSRRYAKRDWNSSVCSRCKLWIYRPAKKQRYKVPVYLWRFKFRGLH